MRGCHGRLRPTLFGMLYRLCTYMIHCIMCPVCIWSTKGCVWMTQCFIYTFALIIHIDKQKKRTKERKQGGGRRKRKKKGRRKKHPIDLEKQLLLDSHGQCFLWEQDLKKAIMLLILLYCMYPVCEVVKGRPDSGTEGTDEETVPYQAGVWAMQAGEKVNVWLVAHG